MSKGIKKAISLFISIVMIVSMFSFTAFAEETGEGNENENKGIIIAGYEIPEEFLSNFNTDIRISEVLGMIFKDGSFTFGIDSIGQVEMKNIALKDGADDSILKLFEEDFLKSLPDNITVELKFQPVEGAAITISGTVNQVMEQLSPYFTEEDIQGYKDQLIEELKTRAETLQTQIMTLTIQDVTDAFQKIVNDVKTRYQELKDQAASMDPEQIKAYLVTAVNDTAAELEELKTLAAKYLDGELLSSFNQAVDTVNAELEKIGTAVGEYSAEDLKNAVDAIRSFASDFYAKLEELGKTDLSIDNIKEVFADTVQQARTAVDDFIKRLDEALYSKIQAAYTELVNSLKNKIVDIQGKIDSFTQENANKTLQDLFTMIGEKTDELKAQAEKLIGDDVKAEWVALSDAVSARIREFKKQLSESVGNAKETLENSVELIREYIAILQEEGPAMLQESMEDAISSIKSAAQSIYEKIKDFIESGKQDDSDKQKDPDKKDEQSTEHKHTDRIKTLFTPPACVTYGSYDVITVCEECGKELSRISVPVLPLGHQYKEVTKAATFKANGYVKKVCIVCGKSDAYTKVNKIKKISLSKTKFTYAAGKVLKPTVTVKDSAGKTISNRYYSVTYSNSSSKKVGTYKVTVTFKGRYSGKKTLSYQIVKAANTMKLKVTSKTVKKTSLKKAKSFTIGVSKAKGTVTYTRDAKAKKAGIKVTSKGKVTIPKNCKKGTYRIAVKAKGNSGYNALTKKVTIKVK